MLALPILSRISVLSRLCLILVALFLVGCTEKTDPEKVVQGKARLIYVPQNGPEAALEWIAYESDLMGSAEQDKQEGPTSAEELDKILMDKASEMLQFPAEHGCELSVEEIRREPIQGKEGKQIHVEYFAFCKSLPGSVTLGYSEFFPRVRTAQLYWTHSGQKDLIELDGEGPVELKKP